MATSPTIDIGAIEQELAALWKDSASKAEGQAVTRALTLNLVVRALDTASADQVSAAMAPLTASHPSRALVLLYRPDAPAPQLDAYVQANCLLTTPGVPQLCGEQVTIDARGLAVGPVASLVLPLLVPDLPVALWMPGPAPFDDTLLARLHGLADRLIVDSRDFANPLRDLAAEARFDRSPVNGLHCPALSDLGWAALTPWRELVAQFFDTRPLLPHLRRLDRVTISAVPTPGAPNLTPGLLLAGWLAASLGWQLEQSTSSAKGDQLRLQLRRPAVAAAQGDTRPVEIEISPAEPSAGAEPGIAAVRLQALDGVIADFSVERVANDPARARTSAQVAGHPPVKRLAQIERYDLAGLVAAELRLLSRDRTFAAALQAAGAFAEQLENSNLS